MSTQQERAALAARVLEDVRRSRPRLAVFDADGTLWAGDFGQEFFYFELDRGFLPAPTAGWARARYAAYLAGQVDEATICGEMVTLHAGLLEAEAVGLAEEFVAAQLPRRAFPEMQKLVRDLAAAGCEIWVVSSTSEWVVRAGVARLGLAPQRVLAAAAAVEAGRVTGRLVRVPTGPAKAEAIQQAIGRAPDAAFGNSMHDAAMLALARRAVAVNPTAELAAHAAQQGWAVLTLPLPV